MPTNLENSALAQDWKRSVFIPITKKGNAKECSNYHIVSLISHASKVMLKILQVRETSTVCEQKNVLMLKLSLEKAEELEIKLPTSVGSRVPEKYLLLLY